MAITLLDNETPESPTSVVSSGNVDTPVSGINNLKDPYEGRSLLQKKLIQDDIKLARDTIKWRQGERKKLDHNALNFEKWLPEVPKEHRVRSLIQGVMDAEMDMNPASVTSYETARVMLDRQVFGGDGSADDDAIFMKIQGRAKETKEKLEFYGKLEDEATLSALMGDDPYLKRLNPKFLFDPVFKKEKARSLQVWKDTISGIEEEYGDILPDVRKLWKMVDQDEPDLYKVADIIFKMDDDELDSAARILGKLQELQGSISSDRGVLGNIGEQSGRDKERTGSGLKGAAIGFFSKVAEGLLIEGEEITGLDNSQAIEGEQGRQENLDRSERFLAEIRRFRDQRDPIVKASKEGSFLGHVEGAVYAIPGVGMTIAASAIPIIGQANTISMLKQSAEDGYYLRALDATGDRNLSRKLAEEVSLPIVALQYLPERFGIGAITRKLPGLNKVLGKLPSAMQGRFARILAGTTARGVAETTTEEIQAILTEFGNDILNGLKEDIPEADWDAHWANFGGRNLETFLSIAPYSGLSAARHDSGLGKAVEVGKKASRDQLLASGYKSEDVDAFQSAETPLAQRSSFNKMLSNQDPKTEEAKQAVGRIIENRKATIAAHRKLLEAGTILGVRMTKDSSSYEVYDTESGEAVTTVETPAEASQIVYGAIGARDRAIQNHVDALTSKLQAARMIVDETGVTQEIEDTKWLTTEEAGRLFEGTDERIAEEVELLEQVEGGSGEVSRAVFDTVTGVNIPAGTYGRINEVTKTFMGSSISTLIHEKSHSVRRKLMANGEFTNDEQIAFFRKLNEVLKGKKTKDSIAKDGTVIKGRSLRFSGFDGETVTETAIDEAWAQFSEVMLLKSKNGKKSTMRELLNTNLSAMVRDGTPGASKFKAFIRAMRDWLGLNLGRAAAIDKALRDGKLDAAEMEKFRAAVMGETIQGQFENEVIETHKENFVPTENIPFSISPAQNGQPVETGPAFSISNINKISSNNKADKLGIARLIPKEYQGKKMLPIMADLLGIGSADGVPIEGGPGHPLLYHGTGVAWRSNKGAIVGILGMLKSRGAIWKDADGKRKALVSVFAMSQDAHQSNRNAFLSFIKVIEDAKVSPEVKERLADYVRKKSTTKAFYSKRLQNFPESWTSQELDAFAEELAFSERASFLKMMRQSGAKDIGVPDAETIVRQLRDDSYDKVSSGSMLSLIEVDVDRLEKGAKENTLNASDFGVPEHLSYDTVLPGKIVTHLRQPVAMEVAFKSMVKKMGEVSPKSRPDYLMQAKLPTSVPLEALTAARIKDINQEQSGQTSIAKAKAYISALSGNWTTIDSKSQKGVADFVAAIDRNLYSETLTPMTDSEVKRKAKEGKMEVFGLQGFDVWFGLQAREDGGKELVSVVSNEHSTGGMLDLVMMKAIEEGATHLDCYAVKNDKMPNGLLPTLYRKHGWKPVASYSYDRQYLGETEAQRDAKEKVLIESWKDQGWDRSLHGMPDVVEMTRESETSSSEELQQDAQGGLAESQVIEAGYESEESSAGNAEVSGSQVDLRESSRNAGRGGKWTPGKVSSFIPELEAASGNRLKAWGITEGQRSDLLASLREGGNAAFSISPAQDKEYLAAVEAGDVAKQQAMVDAKIEKSPYLTRVKRGDGKAFEVFDKSRRGESTKAASAKKAFFFTDEYSPAQTFASMAVNNEAEAYMRDEQEQFIAEENSAWKDAEADILAYANDSKTDTDIAEFINALNETKDTREPMVAGMAEQNNYFGSENVKRWVNAYGSIISESSPEWLTYRQDTKKKLGMEDGGIVRDFVLNLNNYNEIDYKGESSRGGEITYADAIDKAEAEGKDGVILRNTRDAGEVINIYAVFEPNQIKSADPVTYDESGNVVPLSERFNEKDDRISFSLGQSAMVNDVISDVTSRVRDPEARADIFENIILNVDQLRRDTDKPIFGGTVTQKAIVDPREIKSLKKEAAFRQADLHKKYQESKVKKPAEKARNEANAWLQERIAEQKRDYNPMARLRRSLAMLDAIMMALPIELRGKIGGFVQISKLNTEEKRLEFLKDRLDKIDNVVESWVKNNLLKDITKVRSQAKATRKGGKKPKGKLGAEGHRFFDRVENVADLSKEDIEKEEAYLFTEIAKPDGDGARSRIDLAEDLQILQVFGGLNRKNAQELAAASKLAHETYRTKRNQWRVLEENRLGQLKVLVEETIDALGNPDIAAIQEGNEVESDRKEAIKALKSVDWTILSFSEVMERLFGRDHPLAARWSKAVRQAMGARTTAITQGHRRWKKATEEATGKKGRAAQLEVWEMQTKQTIKAAPMKDEKTTVKVPIKTFLQSESRKSLGLTKEEEIDIQDQIDNLKKGSQKKYISIERVKVVPEREANFTDSQAIYLTMLFAQDGYKATMRKHGFGETFQTQLEEGMSDAAKSIREHLKEEYAENYEPLRKIFARMFGMDLPQIKGYTPGKFYSQGDDLTMDVTGSGFVEGGLMTGFLADRKSHSAEPRIESAFSVYFAHLNQTEHWKALAEVSREIRGVFGNPKVKKALKAKNERAAFAVGEWLKAIDGNGFNNPKSNKVFEWLISTQAKLALAWKVSTIAKNFFGASVNAGFKVPLGDFIKGYGRLMNGKIDFRAMMDSELIQQRLDGGFSPEARAAINEDLGGKPTRGNQFVMMGMDVIGKADALGTAMGAAITYDYHYRMLLKEMGPEQAHDLAMDEAAEAIARTAQPVNVTDRSLMELQLTGLGKIAFIFASEARQKSAMWTQAWARTLTGKADKRDYRVLVMAHFVVAPLMHGITSALRDARNDDDDELFDEKNWGAGGWIRSVLTGPISGLPLLREIGDGFNSDDSGPLSRISNAGSSSIDLLQAIFGDEDPKKEEIEWYERKITSVLQAFGATSAVSSSVFDQMFDFIDNIGGKD